MIKKNTEPPPVLTDAPETTFFTEIGIIEQLARNYFERALRGGNGQVVTMAQFGLLNHLMRLGGDWNMIRLAQAFQVSKAAMTKTVGKVEAKGFVSVAPDPADGRGKLVTITEQGAVARNQAIAQLLPFLGEFRDSFPSEKLRDALPTLQAVRKWLDDHRG